MTRLPLSDIPQDIMREASKWTAQCYQPETGTWFDVRDVIAKAILHERQRHAEVMEEVRKVLGPFGNSDMRHVPELNGCESEDSIVAGICDFTYGDLLAAHALLSRLEER